MNQKELSTELVFLLDRSGSMSGLEADTIGGFNATARAQREKGGKVWVTTVFFSGEWERIHDRADLETVPPLTREDYRVGGYTALLDAVGDTVAHMETVHRYIRPEDRPDRTVFVIITDGMENASRRYSRSEIRRTVERKREEGWEFLFLGANIDAEETAEEIGIQKERAANYRATPDGVAKSYRAVSRAVEHLRECSCAPDLQSFVNAEDND